MAERKNSTGDTTSTPVPDVVADPTLSTQAQFSSYKENTSDDLAPDAGRHVVQELGKPRK